MNILTRTFVFALAACLLAAIIAPALGGDGRLVDRPFEVADALKVCTHDELSELSVIKMQALADLLGGIVDEDAARDRAPAAERYYLELELLQARIRMLSPVTLGELKPTRARSNRYTEAGHALDQQIQRIVAIPSLAQHLPSVAIPLHDKVESNKQRRGDTLASTPQTGELFALDADGRPVDEQASAQAPTD